MLTLMVEKSSENLLLLLIEKFANPVHEKTEEKLPEEKQDQLHCSIHRDGNSCGEGED